MVFPGRPLGLEQNMNNFPVQLIGTIYWLPSHKPGRIQFPPDTIFRVSVRFTSDFSPSFSAVVRYSSKSCATGGNPVRLSFPFVEGLNRLTELTRNSEILLIDGYKVIAVCRELKLYTGNAKMGDAWD
jgi:hypothetical protein